MKSSIFARFFSKDHGDCDVPVLQREPQNRSILISSIPIIVFLVLHITRPWLIGFYHDDWSIFVEPSHFPVEKLQSYFLTTFKDRPLLGLDPTGSSPPISS